MTDFAAKGPAAGRVALVTGASRGIGTAIAQRLARDGFSLCLTARDEAALARVISSEAMAGASTLAVIADLAAPDSGDEVVRRAIERFGRLDVVVANAGAVKHGHLLARSDADWVDGFSVKLFGHIRIMRAAWPHLEKVRGTIIALGGAAGRTPTGEYPIGSTVNASVLALAKSLAEFGRTRGVRVNAISPGQIRTDRLAARLARLAEAEGLTPEEAEHRLIAEAGIMQIGRPEDIAGVVSFLAGPDSLHLNGSLIDVDGGMTKGL